eukprot:INCI17318.4.p1 GENE.INCI17318.4~~INCI17318.4.p1  ORF type:complete len:1643 (-),score=275.14 INCI17318.4:498-5267(-)
MATDSELLDLVSIEPQSAADAEAVWAKVLAFPADRTAAFNARDYDKRLPLHVAALRQAPSQVLRFLATRTVRTYRAHVQTQQQQQQQLYDGQDPDAETAAAAQAVAMEAAGGAATAVPLSYMIVAGMWDEVLSAVETVPDATLEAVDVWNRTPLVWAISCGAPATVLDALAARLPCGACTCETQQRRFALHYATERVNRHPEGPDAGALLAEKILNAHRPACREREAQFGVLPLHLAASHGAPKHLISALLAEFPEGIHVRDTGGYSVLTYAVGGNLTGVVPPISALEEIISAMPMALQLGDRDYHCQPLHWACFDSAQPFEVIELLVNKYPESLFVRDKSGKLPIMYAALRDTSTRDSHAVRCLEVCKYLYKSMTKATTNKSARQSSVGQVGDAAGVESWTTLRASAKAPPLPGQSPSSDVTLSDLHSILQDAVCPLVKRWAQTLTCYLGRYSVAPGRAVHASATATVRLARDETCHPAAPVALKWMRNRDQFVREIKLRQQVGCGGSYVVPVRAWHVPKKEFDNIMSELRKSKNALSLKALSPRSLRARRKAVAAAAASIAAQKFAIGDFLPSEKCQDILDLSDSVDEPQEDIIFTEEGVDMPYLLVMDSGGPSLFHVLASQRIAGIDSAKCSALFKNLVEQTARLHADGVAHCDIKPRNVLCKEEVTNNNVTGGTSPHSSHRKEEIEPIEAKHVSDEEGFGSNGKESDVESCNDEAILLSRPPLRSAKSFLVHRDPEDKKATQPSFSLQLCDLDAALPLGSIFPRGMKFSSAYFAPEVAIWHAADPTLSMEDRPILQVDESLDVWSLGVVLYEICTGQHLFPQDMGNDNMVNPLDIARLRVWLCADDDLLRHCFSQQSDEEDTFMDTSVDDMSPHSPGGSALGTQTSAAVQLQRQRKDAQHLIRWCLQRDPQQRPSLNQILSHRFLGGSLVPPSPDVVMAAGGPVIAQNSRRMRYHYFISHMQAEASGDCGTLFHLLTGMGLKCWRDMNQANITEDAMRQGVYDADVFILFLTNSVLSRRFCLMEIGWAIQFQKPILVVQEQEERFWPWDMRRWQNDCCTRVRGQWVKGELGVSFADCPTAVKQLIIEINDSGTALPFRRRDFEAAALVHEIAKRSSRFEDVLWGRGLPWQQPTTHVPGFRSVRFLRQLDSPAGAVVEQELRKSFEYLCSPQSLVWSSNSASPSEDGLPPQRPSHAIVLLCLEMIEKDGPVKAELKTLVSQGVPIQYIYVANSTTGFDADDKSRSAQFDDGVAWDFGVFYSGPESEVKASISSHEALVYRPFNPRPRRYEHKALVRELLKRMQPDASGHEMDCPAASPRSVGAQKNGPEPRVEEDKGGAEVSAAAKSWLHLTKRPAFSGSDVVIEAANGHHTHTVILCHGLYCTGHDFQLLPFVVDTLMKRIEQLNTTAGISNSTKQSSVPDATRSQMAAPWGGVRYIFPTAPKRTISWPVGDEAGVHAWFNYFSDETGNDAYDDIDVEQLDAATTKLHAILDYEFAALDPRGSGENNNINAVLLGGCSQGGTMALHAGLTYAEKQKRRKRNRHHGPPRHTLAAIVALRTILLEETPLYGGSAPPIRIFSAAEDEV